MATGTGHHHLQVRGSGVWGKVNWVRHKFGEVGIERLLGAVSAAGRNLLRSDVDRTAWYNFPMYIELSVAVDELFGSGDGTLNQEISCWTAHTNIPRFFSMFIRIGSVAWVLDRAAAAWAAHFNAGKLVLSADAHEHTAYAEIVDFPMPHLVHTYSVLGYACGMLELSGAKNVRGELVSCRSKGAEKTVFRARWGDDEPTT